NNNPVSQRERLTGAFLCSCEYGRGEAGPRPLAHLRAFLPLSAGSWRDLRFYMVLVGDHTTLMPIQAIMILLSKQVREYPIFMLQILESALFYDFSLMEDKNHVHRMKDSEAVRNH